MHRQAGRAAVEVGQAFYLAEGDQIDVGVLERIGAGAELAVRVTDGTRRHDGHSRHRFGSRPVGAGSQIRSECAGVRLGPGIQTPVRGRG
jgi:hypothetical protein